MIIGIAAAVMCGTAVGEHGKFLIAAGTDKDYGVQNTVAVAIESAPINVGVHSAYNGDYLICHIVINRVCLALLLKCVRSVYPVGDVAFNMMFSV